METSYEECALTIGNRTHDLHGMWEASIVGKNGSHDIKAVAKKVPSECDMEMLRQCKQLKHPHILKFIGECHDKNETFIVMEHPTNGSLFDYLMKSQDALPSKQIYMWAIQIASAIAELHGKGLYFINLNSHEVYITVDNSLKLDAFGLVKHMEHTKSTDGKRKARLAGTMPPEVIQDQSRSPKSDIFSYGIMVWQLVTRESPFEEMKSEYTVMNAVCEGKRPTIPDDCPEDLRYIIEKCWQNEYHNRPDIQTVLGLLEGRVPRCIPTDSELSGAYQSAMDVKVPVHRTNIFLIGEAGAGKTSLMSFLTKAILAKINSYTNQRLSSAPSSSYGAHIWTDNSISKGIPFANSEFSSSVIAKVMVEQIGKHEQATEPTSSSTSLTLPPPSVLAKVTDCLAESKQFCVDKSFDIWDCAGKYHETQALLHGGTKCVLILAFNLADDLAKEKENCTKVLDGLSYWISYIQSNLPQKGDTKQQCPLIILVCTHRDSISMSRIKEKFDQIQDFVHGKKCQDLVHREYFAIGSKHQDEKSKQTIQSILSAAESHTQISEEVSIRWVVFEVAVAEAIEEGHKVMTVNEIYHLMSSKHALKMDDGEMLLLLQWYHDMGIIIFEHGGNKDRILSSDACVITDPPFLVEIYQRMTNVPENKLQLTDHIDAWGRLETKGIIEDKLIDYLFKDLGIPVHKSAILELLKKYYLIYVYETHPEGMSYWIPGTLPIRRPSDKELFHSKSAVVFFIVFEFLPVGLFHNLVMHLVDWGKQKTGSSIPEPQLYYQSVKCKVDQYHEVTLLASTMDAHIKVAVSHVYSESEDVDKPPTPQICTQIQQMLAHTVKELSTTYCKAIEYNFSIACPCGAGQTHYLNLEMCLSSDENQCSQGKSVNTKQLREWLTYDAEKQTDESATKKSEDDYHDSDESLECDSAPVSQKKLVSSLPIQCTKEEIKHAIGNVLGDNAISDSVINVLGQSGKTSTSDKTTEATKDKGPGAIQKASKDVVQQSSAINGTTIRLTERCKTNSQIKQTIAPPDGVRIHIVTHPRTDGLIFASVSSEETLSASSKLKGPQNSYGNDTEPTFRVTNYQGPVCLLAWLATEESYNHPHPHKLDGTNCMDGIYCHHTYLDNPGQLIRLHNLHIVGVQRENVALELELRKATLKKLCATLEFQTGKPSEYDLGRVVLCLMGYIPHDAFHIPLAPQTTYCLFDRGNILKKEPRIHHLSESKGPVGGGHELKLVVSRLKSGEGTVLFTLNTIDPPSTWQTLATISESVKQISTVLITISTPSFYNKEITSPVTVKVQVRRADDAISNTLPYTFVPSTDDSGSIVKKVNKRRPIFQNHFMCIGATSRNELEYDDKESKMGMPKKKRLPKTRLTPQELATSENLMEVINRLPQVIPNRPLPKPKQKQKAGAVRRVAQQRPRDKSDGASTDDPDNLRKMKAFAANHGYKKTVKRIDEYVEKYREMDYPEGVLEEDVLPPANAERRARDVSEWVSSTVHKASPTDKPSQRYEEGSQNSEQAKTEESERETIKAIADGSAKCEPDLKIDSNKSIVSVAGNIIVPVSDDVKTSNNDTQQVEGWTSSVASTSSRGAEVEGGATCKKSEGWSLQDISKDLILDEKIFRWGVVLGSGSCGSVYRVEVTNMKQEGMNVVAAKKISPEASLQEDLNTLVSLAHPNIVSVYGIFHPENDVLWAMEFMSRGCLEQYLNDFAVPNAKMFSFASQAASALEYLHARELVHGSVSAKSCYIGDEDILKLRVLTPNSQKVKGDDMFGFGLLLSHMFEIQTTTESISKDVKSAGELPNQVKCTKMLQFLITVCWKKDHKSRPTIQTVKTMLGHMEDLCDSTEPLNSGDDSAIETGTCSSTSTSSSSSLSSTVYNSTTNPSAAAIMLTADSGFCHSTFRSQDPSAESLNVKDPNKTPHHSLSSSECDSIAKTLGSVTIESDREMQIFGDHITNSSPSSLPPILKTGFRTVGKSKSLSLSTVGRLEVDACIENPHSSHYSSPRPQSWSGGVGRQGHESSDKLMQVISAGPPMEQKTPASYPKASLQQDVWHQPLHYPAKEPFIQSMEKISTPAEISAPLLKETADAQNKTLTPPKVELIVDHTGGLLELEGCNVSLTIPEGALPEGSKESISISLIWDNASIDVKERKCNVAPAVRCLPTGLKFLKHVILQIPHCAHLEDPSKYQSHVLCNEKETDQPPEWIRALHARTEIFANYILLYVTHFTDFIVDIGGVLHKRLEMVVYVSPVETVNHEQDIRVYLYNDHEPAKKKVEAAEDGIKKNPTQSFLYMDNSKPMNVRLAHFPHGWNLIYGEIEDEIPHKRIWHNERISSQFLLDNTTQLIKFHCMIKGYQEGNDDTAEIKVTNHVRQVTPSSQLMDINRTPAPQVMDNTPSMIGSSSHAYYASQETRCTSFQGSTGEGPGTLSSCKSEQQQMLVARYGSQISQTYIHPSQLQNSGHSSGSVYSDQQMMAIQGSPLTVVLPFDKTPCGPSFLPYSVEMDLCRKLNGYHPLDKDWRALAGAYQFTAEEIQSFERNRNPCKDVLTCIKSRGLVNNPKQIADTLRRELGRTDAAKVIDSYLCSLDKPTSPEPMNTTFSSCGSSSAGNSPNGNSDVRGAPLDSVGTKRSLAGQFGATQTPIMPSSASEMKNVGENTIFSPPPTSTRAPPMTTTTSTNTVPLSQRVSAGVNLNNQLQNSEEVPSNGPTNVQPHEYQSVEGTLEVDGDMPSTHSEHVDGNRNEVSNAQVAHHTV